MEADSGDSAAVHFGDGQFVAVDVRLVAAHGDATEARGEEAADGLVRAVGEFDTGLLGEVVEVEQAVDLDIAAA